MAQHFYQSCGGDLKLLDRWSLSFSVKRHRLTSEKEGQLSLLELFCQVFPSTCA